MYGRGDSKWSHTFNYWFVEEPGEVTILDNNTLDSEYKSDYVKCYNYILSKGWSFENKKWVSSDSTYKMNNVYDAYRKQVFLETVLNKGE